MYEYLTSKSTFNPRPMYYKTTSFFIANAPLISYVFSKLLLSKKVNRLSCLGTCCLHTPNNIFHLPLFYKTEDFKRMEYPNVDNTEFNGFRIFVQENLKLLLKVFQFVMSLKICWSIAYIVCHALEPMTPYLCYQSN